MQLMSLFCGQQLLNTVPEPFRRNLKLSCLFRYNVYCIQGHFPWKQAVQKSGASIILNFSVWPGGGGGTPYSRLHREALPKRGAFHREALPKRGAFHREALPKRGAFHREALPKRGAFHREALPKRGAFHREALPKRGAFHREALPKRGAFHREALPKRGAFHREALPKRGAFSTQGREVYCLKGFWNRP